MAEYATFCHISRMTRADRLELLLHLLRDHPGITAARLAEPLGTSLRSVFRDLESLRERGYPIEGGRGRGGGLRLHPGWGLSRVLLATEEALGTLLALAIAEKLSFPMFEAGVARARRKIVAAFPSAERRRLDPLRERMLIGPPASRAVRSSWAEPNRQTTRRLQNAFVEERVVRAHYQREDGERAWRTLEPHAILINWPAWYLLALDRERGAGRTFRFDRFQGVDEENGPVFRPRPRQLALEVLGPEVMHGSAGM
jgi:predicted DNA-binding transcriptional regulator YafY